MTTMALRWLIRRGSTAGFLTLLFLALSSRAAPAHSAASLSRKLTAAEKAAAARITAAEISGHTRFLSDDLLEGRFPGTRGDEVATRYLATELETMGFRPGAEADGKSSWFQKAPLVRHTVSVPRRDAPARALDPRRADRRPRLALDGQHRPGGGEGRRAR